MQSDQLNWMKYAGVYISVWMWATHYQSFC